MYKSERTGARARRTEDVLISMCAPIKRCRCMRRILVVHKNPSSEMSARWDVSTLRRCVSEWVKEKEIKNEHAQNGIINQFFERVQLSHSKTVFLRPCQFSGKTKSIQSVRELSRENRETKAVFWSSALTFIRMRVMCVCMACEYVEKEKRVRKRGRGEKTEN